MYSYTVSKYSIYIKHNVQNQARTSRSRTCCSACSRMGSTRHIHVYITYIYIYIYAHTCMYYMCVYIHTYTHIMDTFVHIHAYNGYI